MLKTTLLLLFLTATALTLAGCGSPFDQPDSNSPGFQTLEAEASPTATATPTAEQCDPSYPTVCIHRPPPDLDCTDFRHRNFEVLPPDPHGFDEDGNGIGCEG